MSDYENMLSLKFFFFFNNLLESTLNKYVLSHFSHVLLVVTLWTVAHQAPLSMGFSRQECSSGLSCPSPGDFPDPEVKPGSVMFPALADGFFTLAPLRKPLLSIYIYSLPSLFKKRKRKGKLIIISRRKSISCLYKVHLQVEEDTFFLSAVANLRSYSSRLLLFGS